MVAVKQRRRDAWLARATLLFLRPFTITTDSYYLVGFRHDVRRKQRADLVLKCSDPDRAFRNTPQFGLCPATHTLVAIVEIEEASSDCRTQHSELTAPGRMVCMRARWSLRYWPTCWLPSVYPRRSTARNPRQTSRARPAPHSRGGHRRDRGDALRR